jgi:carboxypeptidase Taq
MPSSAELFAKLRAYAAETAYLYSASALLGWDQQTGMPPAGNAFRADQMAYFSSKIHERATSAEYGELIESLAASELAKAPYSDEGATIRVLKREYDRERKIPAQLVAEMARVESLAQQAWAASRKANDFKGFAPHLEIIFRLKRELAQAIGYVNHPYDALLDKYEPEMTTPQANELLAGLRDALRPIVQAVTQSPKRAPVEILHRSYPVALQHQFGKHIAGLMGFAFHGGRLDTTEHPFCETVGPGDIRLTTRYDERLFGSGLYSILHEAGHGMYEQGLRSAWFGMPPGSACSLGVHESQSRLWENLVGRSRAFWSWCFPLARAVFPEPLKDVTPEDFYFAANEAKPSLVRVEADEVTYNLHIIIRSELEQELLDERLKVADLPGAWNERYQKYLGIVPTSDAEGVLQDVHWSAGLIGYFPTYSLGNIYASCLFAAADKALGSNESGGLEAMFARGEFAPLLEWLRTNVHERGQTRPAAMLIEEACGVMPTHEPLITHLRSKYGELYGFA